MLSHRRDDSTGLTIFWGFVSKYTFCIILQNPARNLKESSVSSIHLVKREREKRERKGGGRREGEREGRGERRKGREEEGERGWRGERMEGREEGGREMGERHLKRVSLVYHTQYLL